MRLRCVASVFACFLATPALALAGEPAPNDAERPAPAATRTPGPNNDLLYKASLAPDALLTYIQLTSAQRRTYRFYARHMNETQRLEYLRRVRPDDREQYARDLGLPQQLEEVPEPNRTRVMDGTLDLGMTRDEVELALGEPAGKMLGAGTIAGKQYENWERWSYQRRNGPFSVWFSGGKVIGYDPGSGPPADDSLPDD